MDIFLPVATDALLGEECVEAWTKLAGIPGLSKEKRRALHRAESFFTEDDKHKKWDQFAENVKRKSFTHAVQDDPRADDKLRLHAENLNRLRTGKTIGHVKDYRIVELRGGGLGCTCGDWKYVRSVAPSGSRDCKHIREFKAKKKG